MRQQRGALRTTTSAAIRGEDGTRTIEMPIPDAAAGELLVRIDLATLCGRDRRGAPGTAHVPGHEGVGRVVAAGHGAPAQVGDRVVWSPAVGCRRCDRCRDGRPTACRRPRRVGREPWSGPWSLSGTFAAHLLLPAGAAVAHVPGELCDAVAAPAGCATATAMAALDTAGDVAGRRVLVVGAGMLGLTLAAACRVLGASDATIVDPDAARRSLATAFGATAVRAPDDALDEVDLAFACAGADAAQAALPALAHAGRLVLVGDARPDEVLAVPTALLARRRLSFAGVHDGEPEHLAAALDFLLRTRGRFPWERLAAPAFGLDALPMLLAQPPMLAPRQAIAP
ncbi:alcohol dehydrogenase catalytic domain-containing protein [Microbacterium gilvum]|uniref:Dehydrogenase n=1 Tax=Microbacterium gilvum TaxID=1336204 RepID=A0ABP9ABQ4_9MICO